MTTAPESTAPAPTVPVTKAEPATKRPATKAVNATNASEMNVNAATAEPNAREASAGKPSAGKGNAATAKPTRAGAAAGDTARQHTVVDSPYGPLTLVATGGVLSGLYMEGQRHRPAEETFGEPDASPFAEAVRQLDAYFARELTAFDLPMRLAGTPFQLRVWEQLRRIPYGETRTYGELAAMLGNPNASRAVGLANGKNPVGIIVPCHRVIGASGSLVGYGGGLGRKQRLLAFEGDVPEETLF